MESWKNVVYLSIVHVNLHSDKQYVVIVRIVYN